MAKIQAFNMVLAAESMANPFSSLTQNISDGIASVTSTVTNSLNDFIASFTTDGAPLELGFSPTQTAHTLKNVRYTDIMELKAYAPAGLTVKWKVYLDELCYSAELLAGIEKNLLRPFREFLSKILEGKSSGSISGLNIDIKKYRDARVMCMENISKLFSRSVDNNDNLETSWNKVVANNSDWSGVCTLTTKLVDSLNDLNRKKLKRNADNTSALMKAVINSNFTEYNKKILSDISEGATEYVKFLEFYTVTYYRALTMLGAIKLTSEHILGSLSDRE